MKKILLIFEDYNELTSTEVYLKKVGFDALGVSNELLLNEQIMTFNPDIIVASGKSNRVSSYSIGMKLKENLKFHGKVVIIFPQGQKPSPQDMIKLRMDATLNAPVEPIRLIQVLAKLTNQDTIHLMEKFKKATMSDPALQNKFNVAGAKANADQNAIVGADKARMKRYEKYLHEIRIDVHKSTFNKQEIKDRQNELKKSWDFEALEEQDRLKQQFAEALFKKR